MTPVTQIFGALAGLALMASAPLTAQENPPVEALPQGLSEEPAGEFDATFSDEPQKLLPSDMTADQFIQFFTLFSESEPIEATLSAFTKQMLVKGEKIEDWQNQGIDILAELSALDGGVAGNFLREIDDDFAGVTDLSGTMTPDMSGFESFALRPEPVGLVAEKALISFVPGVWFEAAMQRDQRGKALCYGGYFGVTLHTKRHYTRWSERELIGIATMFALFDRLSSIEFCTIYSRDKDGNFVTRGVLPDGTDLPVMNAEPDTSVLMLESDLDAFVTAGGFRGRF